MVQFCDDPQKISTKSSYPKNIHYFEVHKPPCVEAHIYCGNASSEGEELYKLHAYVLILILLFQIVFTMYKLI